jgi:hypothetical protein
LKSRRQLLFLTSFAKPRKTASLSVASKPTTTQLKWHET